MPDSSHSLEYADAADRLFADIADPQARILADADAATIWSAIEEVVFPFAWVPEEAGGAGLTLEDVGQIVESAGRHAVNEPLVDTILARHWAAFTGLDLPAEGPVTFHPQPLKVNADGGVQSSFPSVQQKTRQVVVPGASSEGLVLIACSLGHQGQLALDGELLDGSTELPVSPLELQASAAAMASAWIAGALRGLLNMCVVYAEERKAFGRSIGKFQAIQHHIAHLATEVAAAETSARVALAAIDHGNGVFEAAAAKTRTDEAGRIGCRIAHQVFGAIGFTIEHPLHLYTSGIEHWRNRYGTGPYWAVEIGRAALAGGAASLWPAITEAELLSSAMKERQVA